MNNLSRNKPVAFVVGAAGFIGSSLTEKLLGKGIQVIGVDSFYGGHRENLTDAAKDRNFHLISQSLVDIDNLDLMRLDYAFFVISENLPGSEYENNLQKFLDICTDFKPKTILCSSINLYDAKQEESDNLKDAEKKLAQIALTNKINARVVRLSGIFGPRMNFRNSDPIIRLIKSAVTDKLNTEQTPLEFTTRALFIGDAVDLLIKAVMHGSTAQKIYDGCSPEPIKVSEIKQVLMDPVWYEEKGFRPTELPPWLTPNLNKTIKELSWKPHTDIISALKNTLAYFKEHQSDIPKEIISEKKQSIPWQFSKSVEIPDDVKEREGADKKNTGVLPKSKKKGAGFKTQIITTFGIVVIFFAIIFPVIKFVFYGVDAKIHLENSIKQVSLGNFDEALRESSQAAEEARYLSNSFENLSFVKKIDAAKIPFTTIEQSLSLANLALKANLHTVNGAKLLANSFAVISGEKEGDTRSLLNDANAELSDANSKIGQVSANLNDERFVSRIPPILQQELRLLDDKITSYNQTINLGLALTTLLPQIIAPDSEKSYLVIFQDNRMLRPGGGVIRSYVKVSFNHEKLKEIKGDIVENLDRSFDARIDPPTELKNDLGISNWRMKDAAFDPDFPISAQNIAWFFEKESGTNISGIITLDLESTSRLLAAVGPLKIGKNGEEITSTNVSQKIALTRDGNQASADILKVLVERIFYLSKQDWVVLAKNSGESLSQKDFLIYLSDPNAFSNLSSSGWTGAIPRPVKEKLGERNESLLITESNMTQGQDSTALDRSIDLQSKIDSAGTVTHKLTLDYSASDKLTGPYKYRLKIYLPGGTKLLKTTWGNSIVKDISQFSDYGMSGYSVLLNIDMGQQKQLAMEYQDLNPVKFDSNNQLKFKLNVIKQIGQESIPLDFRLDFPKEIKAESSMLISLGEVSAKDKINRDLTFEVVLRK